LPLRSTHQLTVIMKKWYTRRGGFIARTPWGRRGTKNKPFPVPVPFEQPKRRPYGLPVPRTPGPIVVYEHPTQLKPKPQQIRINKKVATNTKNRGFNINLRNIRDVYEIAKRLRSVRRKKSGGMMSKVGRLGTGTSRSYFSN